MRSFIVFIVVLLCASTAIADTRYIVLHGNVTDSSACTAAQVTVGSTTYTVKPGETTDCIAISSSATSINVSFLWIVQSGCGGSSETFCSGLVPLASGSGQVCQRNAGLQQLNYSESQDTSCSSKTTRKINFNAFIASDS
jgi:hypothetical protein